MLVLLHGYGADESDLFSLASLLDPSIELICPRAPVALDYGGYAWFDLYANGSSFRYEPDEIMKSATEVGNWISRLRLANPDRKLFLGGFSQGAAISLAAALVGAPLDGLIFMSGMMGGENPAIPPPAIPTILVHGTGDPLLPVDLGREVHARMKSWGWTPEHHEFEMGHEITQESFGAVQSWLSRQTQLVNQ